MQILIDFGGKHTFLKAIFACFDIEKNSDMIFEQDFAQPHSTNVNQEFMETHFPAHTPTLWRYEGEDPLFFGPKWDGFWSIERLWGIHSQRVYRNPRPTY